MKHQLKELLERNISELGQAKRAIHCEPELSLSNAISSLKLNNVGSLVIVEGARVIGIFTERDVLLKCALQDIPLGTAKVSDYMTKNPICVQRFETIGNVLVKMKSGKFRHIIIVDAYGNLEKVVSQREIMDYLLQIFLTA
jgi:CBS domain-containing protein